MGTLLNERYATTPSPASTPESSTDEEKYLVSYQINQNTKNKWYNINNTPFSILFISLIQFLIHIFSTATIKNSLRFEPNKKIELWRFITYMLVHDDWYHLLLNIIIQCIFAILLEKRQGHLRVLILYLIGGFTGVLGASCFHPDVVIGASAGVYALLISNVSDIVLNYTSLNYKMYRMISIGILVLFDIVYNIVHAYTKNEPVISWEAHFVGGLSGLLLGLLIYKSENKVVNKLLFWLSLLIYFFVVVLCVIVTLQIKRCTPTHIIRFKYVYFC